MMTDPTGDSTAAANAALDIQSVSIAEPYYTDGSQKLVFTMKVASLASVPAGAEWRILWNFPTTVTGSYYVEMNTDPSGVVAFQYGTIDLTSAVVTAVGQPHLLGVCDAESTYLPDGTIRLVLSTSKIGNAAAGDVIGGLLARTFVTTGSVVTSSRTAVDTAATTGTYLMVGNNFCAPPAVTTIEDDDSRIAYSNGWHLLQDGNASAGHFRFASGKPKASLAFTVPSNQFGSITYNYAKSTKGGLSVPRKTRNSSSARNTARCSPGPTRSKSVATASPISTASRWKTPPPTPRRPAVPARRRRIPRPPAPPRSSCRRSPCRTTRKEFPSWPRRRWGYRFASL